MFLSKTLEQRDGSKRKVMVIIVESTGTNSRVRTVVMYGNHQAASKSKTKVQVLCLTGMIYGSIHADVTLVKR
jgi:hypothetical protein